MTENKLARYVVDFVINVQRVDGQMLAAEENAMVDEMQEATHAAIEAVMAKHGQRELTRAGRKVVF